tara:strand:+ start:2264 stop:3814 length:1551 start_codon:yes stop_codon:yes gene_type:complete
MNNTDVKLHDKARAAIKVGVDLVASLVKVSLGAEGRNVIIPDPHGPGYILTKDGVSIAKSINPANTYTAIGAALIKEAAARTNLEAGDGTTTATVLAQAIFNGGLALLEQGLSPVELKRGIDAAVIDVVAHLKAGSRKVTKTNLKDIATISANGDIELGEKISQAFNKIGEHGRVLIETSDTRETHIELREGVVLERGWTSSIFKTDDIKEVSVLKKPFVLLHKGKIEKGDEIVDLFDKVFSHAEGNLLIITDDIDPFVHSVISQNVTNGAIKNKICVVKMPQILKIHKDLLNDLAVLTGATIISDELGTKINIENLGRIRQSIVNEKETIVVGDQKRLVGVIKEIRKKLSIQKNRFEKEELQERLARITGGVATLYVGANSDSELLEKKDRVEDSINATRSALEEGIVAGGGIALCNAANELEDLELENKPHYDVGYQLVVAACYAPAIQICINADMEVVKHIVDKGLNVKTGEVVNMFDAGIIDPAKVTRWALENAASVAGLFLTTEGVVARIN